MNILNQLKKLDFKTLLIIALVIIVLLMRACQPSGPESPKEQIKIDGKKYEVIKRVTDTIIVDHITTLYKPGKDIYHETVIHDKIPVGTDTLAILNDYFANRIYTDTLTLKDSLGYVIVKDTINKNSILGRTFNANVREKVINNTIYVEPVPVAQLYIGGILGFDKANVVNFAGPSLLLKTKADKIYSLGIGYSAGKQIGIMGSIYWKIKLKK